MELKACLVSPSRGCGGRAGPGRCGREALLMPEARVWANGDMVPTADAMGKACVIMVRRP
jgi:hypothetical protein